MITKKQVLNSVISNPYTFWHRNAKHTRAFIKTNIIRTILDSPNIEDREFFMRCVIWDCKSKKEQIIKAVNRIKDSSFYSVIDERCDFPVEALITMFDVLIHDEGSYHSFLDQKYFYELPSNIKDTVEEYLEQYEYDDEYEF